MLNIPPTLKGKSPNSIFKMSFGFEKCGRDGNFASDDWFVCYAFGFYFAFLAAFSYGVVAVSCSIVVFSIWFVWISNSL